MASINNNVTEWPRELAKDPVPHWRDVNKKLPSTLVDGMFDCFTTCKCHCQPTDNDRCSILEYEATAAESTD